MSYESDEDWESREAAIADRAEQIKDHREGRDEAPEPLDRHGRDRYWHYATGETREGR